MDYFDDKNDDLSRHKPSSHFHRTKIEKSG